MKKTKIFTLLGLMIGCFISTAYGWQLQPFETTYTATISNVPFDGQATYSLVKQANGWHFETKASMAFAERVEHSSFTIEKNIIKPTAYEFKQTGIKPKKIILSFDWAKNFAKGHISDKKKDDDIFFDLKYKMLDQLSSQLALQIDIAQGKKQMVYPVIEDDRIETYKFKVVGDETIDTPVGKLKTVKVQRVRGAGSKRQSFIWFAKDWNYTVVRLYHLEKNGQEYIISLAGGVVNKEAIKGK